MSVPERYKRRLVRLLQVGLLALTVYGIYRGKVGVAVNGGVSLLVTFVPALLRRDWDVSMSAGFVLWLTAAVFVHAVGILGPYKQYPWYDSVAHALSASVVAGTSYAFFRAVELHSERVELPRELRFLFVLVFALAFGVLWEVLEFTSGFLANALGSKPVLIQFGMKDIILDLVFDFVGGVVVVAWSRARPMRIAWSLAASMGGDEQQR
ncbi:hypothetical protein [Haladaptatus salinisoli]|uniref:hypothetical protein n=1 Tax=Haladaptatus salinisoli TaxID=2884876 RepID=UPI001D0A3842|nr:hypothetical protein [Haladaptatus salinisoli]